MPNLTHLNLQAESGFNSVPFLKNRSVYLDSGIRFPESLFSICHLNQTFKHQILENFINFSEYDSI